MSTADSLIEEASTALVRMSRIIDEYNRRQGKSSEAMLWGRVAKVGEEGGEVIGAMIGVTNQNPRKGRTHTLSDVEKELQDVAITALGAIEHINGHYGRAIDDLLYRITQVKQRLEDET